jgi:hypothetical protein
VDADYADGQDGFGRDGSRVRRHNLPDRSIATCKVRSSKQFCAADRDKPAT